MNVKNSPAFRGAAQQDSFDGERADPTAVCSRVRVPRSASVGGGPPNRQQQASGGGALWCEGSSMAMSAAMGQAASKAHDGTTNVGSKSTAATREAHHLTPRMLEVQARG